MCGFFFSAENLKGVVENALSIQAADSLDVVFRHFQFIQLGRRGVDLGLNGVQLDQHWASSSSALQMKIHFVHENVEYPMQVSRHQGFVIGGSNVTP